MNAMFDRLRRWLRPRQKSPEELAEDEATQRRLQKELQAAEQRKFEERQRMDSGGGAGGRIN